MSRNDSLRDQILRRLAEWLDDDALTRLFPDMTPAQVRQLITGAPPEVEQPSPAADHPAQATVSRTEHCRLFTDGASRGNPGLAGAGAVLLDGNNVELATISSFLGVCTNNVAEYRALLLGLDKTLTCGCTRLELFLDSELIVRQIQGTYKVKNETLLPLYQQVRELLTRLESWSISHVPRSRNARADQLANQGIDSRTKQKG